MDTFLVLLLVSLSNAQFWYSGDLAFVGTQQARPVDTSFGNSTCILRQTPSAFQSFSFEVVTPSFYFITGAFQFPNWGQVQLYSGSFSSSNPCANLIIANSSRSDTPTPHLQFVQYLQSGTYTVVVTGKGAINLGLFVVHVDRANFTSASSANGNWWNAPMQQLDRFLCQDSTFAVPYTTISWTQTTSGFYDLIFFGYNSSYSDIDISVGIYNSSQPSFVGTGNSGSPASGCTSFHFPRSTSNRIDNFIYGVTGIQSDISAPFQSGFATSVALYIELRAGTSYTAVIGAYQASGRTGTFGMLSRPSIVGYLNNQKIFPTPIVNGDVRTFSCNESGYLQYWDAVGYTAQNSIYIFSGASSDFIGVQCLYSGFNLGVPPITCPSGNSSTQFLQCGDSFGEGPMAISTLIPGENYTFISLPLANAGFAQGRYIAYKYTGQVLGGISVSTGGFYTTNALTSGVISTGEVTSGLITTGQVVNPPVTTGISNTGCMNQCISDCGGGQVVSCVCNSQGGVVSVTCTSADSSGKILSASVAFMFFLILF